MRGLRTAIGYRQIPTLRKLKLRRPTRSCRDGAPLHLFEGELPDRDTMKAMGYFESVRSNRRLFSYGHGRQTVGVTPSASAGKRGARAVSGRLERLDWRTGFGVHHTENLQLPIQGAFFKPSM